MAAAAASATTDDEPKGFSHSSSPRQARRDVSAAAHTQSFDRSAKESKIGQTGKGVETAKHLENERQKSTGPEVFFN
jgi:hypothetical protein